MLSILLPKEQITYQIYPTIGKNAYKQKRKRKDWMGGRRDGGGVRQLELTGKVAPDDDFLVGSAVFLHGGLCR